MGTRERRERSDASDKELVDLFHGALVVTGVLEEQITLCAVGGFGRGELAPGSDLDITLLHSGLKEATLNAFVSALLNPLWSVGRQVDYSVRTRGEAKTVARSDFKVAMGLLDLRYLAGNEELAQAVFDDARKNWEKNILTYLPPLRASIEERAERSGELAYLLEPDLKESRGGLRDIHALRAIDESHLVVVEKARLAESEALLANTRDVLHEVTKRSRDQLMLTEQDHVAAEMGFSDADAMMEAISKAARTVDYVMAMTWHRISLQEGGLVDSLTRKFRSNKPKPIAKGLASLDGELLLTEQSYDYGLGLRAAALAAQRGLRLSVETAIEIAENFQPIPEPWPRVVREDFVTLLGAGSEMLDVFEALDQEGLIEKWIPEWEHVRFLPQRNVLHHHTVDRHMLQTVIQAAALTRSVHRPDILLFAALFHDIAKGYEGHDHSEYGAELIVPIARRLGFNEEDADVMAKMVLHHLLLSTVATRRDLDDPLTIDYVKELVGDAELLELLHALAIADGEATGKTAWSAWKAGLVADLVNRVRAAMEGVEPAERIEISEAQLAKVESGQLSLELKPVESSDGFIDIEIVVEDRPGLLSTVAAVLSISKMDVRSAKTRTINRHAVMNWLVKVDVNAPVPTVEAILEKLDKGFDDPDGLSRRITDRISTHRFTPGFVVPPPAVSAINNGATDATIVEVRMHDQPGILYTVTRAISEFGCDIKGAIVATLGAEAFDTIYVAELHSGGALSPERSQALTDFLTSTLLSAHR